MERTRSTTCESNSQGFASMSADMKSSAELMELVRGPKTDSLASIPRRTLTAPSYGRRRDVGRRLTRPQ